MIHFWIFNLKKKRKLNQGCFGKHRKYAALTAAPPTFPSPPPPTQPLQVENVKLTEAENDQSKHAFSVPLAPAMAAEAAVASAHTVAKAVRLSSLSRYPGKSKEEIAAIKMQTAFRGYLVCLEVKFSLLSSYISLRCLVLP